MCLPKEGPKGQSYVSLLGDVDVMLMLCLKSEDAFVITCVANLMEVKVL
jgi:hypothetical protein